MSNLPHYPVHPHTSGQSHPAYGYGQQPLYGHPYPYGAPAGPQHPRYLMLADLGSRAGARVLDLVIWFITYMATGGLWLSMWIDSGGGETAQAVLVGWLAVTFLIYFPFCITEFGSTLGKRICGVRVVHRTSGQHIGFWRALLRELFWPAAWFVPVLGLVNSLWCTWDKPNQQCLHDKIVNTIAVERV